MLKIRTKWKSLGIRALACQIIKWKRENLLCDVRDEVLNGPESPAAPQETEDSCSVGTQNNPVPREGSYHPRIITTAEVQTSLVLPLPGPSALRSQGRLSACPGAHDFLSFQGPLSLPGNAPSPQPLREATAGARPPAAWALGPGEPAVLSTSIHRTCPSRKPARVSPGDRRKHTGMKGCLMNSVP